jgi:hypothetical protein
LKIPKIKVGEPIEVEWYDAGYDDNDPISWTSLQAMTDLEEIKIKSIGFFVKVTKNTLFFCMSMEEREKGDSYISNKGQVPLGCIKTLTKLRK